MSTVNKLKASINSLSEKDFAQLRNWIAEKDWRRWDKEIEEDSKTGKLDFLVSEALDEKSKGKLKEL